MFLLVSKDDLGRRLVFPIVRVKTTIGRDESCDITLDDEEVSRQHAKLYVIDHQLQVKDMGSTNGTFLNNVRIERITAFKPGDQIIIGPNMFDLEETEGAEERDIELTCVVTMAQLREMTNRPIPERPTGNGISDAEMTRASDRDELMAGIYQKKIDVAKHPSIEIIYGNDAGRKYLLLMGEYTLGRGEKCNIHLNDERVSSVHGRFIVKSDGVTYRDEGSLNGSVLNNQNVREGKLKHRDTLMLGKTKLRFLDPKRAGEVKVSRKGSDPVGKAVSAPRNDIEIVEIIKKYWFLTGGVAIGMIVLLYFLIAR